MSDAVRTMDAEEALRSAAMTDNVFHLRTVLKQVAHSHQDLHRIRTSTQYIRFAWNATSFVKFREVMHISALFCIALKWHPAFMHRMPCIVHDSCAGILFNCRAYLKLVLSASGSRSGTAYLSLGECSAKARATRPTWARGVGRSSGGVCKRETTS